MTEETKNKALKVVLLSQLLVEANDDIKGTVLYKGKVKQYGNIFINQLKANIRITDEVYSADPEMATNLFNELDGLVEKLATLDVVGLTMIKQMHDVYSNNQEDWDNMFKLELTKLQE